MKQRITYLLPDGSGLDPADIKVQNDSLEFTRTAEAAEEWRLTLGFNDLPEEVCCTPLAFSRTAAEQQ